MMRFLRLRLLGLLLGITSWLGPVPANGQPPLEPAQRGDVFDRSNLMAWCIVPFDAKKRTPEERAAMLDALGIRKFAYDWRAEHLPRFTQELDTLKRHGIELTALWFPSTLDDTAQFFLDELRTREMTTQLWILGSTEPTNSPQEQKERVAAEVARIRPIAEAAFAQGCRVGLYNHGGWFGEPENQIEILQALKMPNVGIVYNLHHGHDHIDRFPVLFEVMKPYLIALNLNGMVRDGEATGQKIVVIGEGELDVYLMRIIRDSGWYGPVGILNHTDEDAEARLKANLEGLEKVIKRLEGEEAPK